MTFYQIIKAGKKIIIDTTGTNYTATTFFYKNNKIWFSNSELGAAPHPTFTPAVFNNHIEQMIKENFKIIIMEV